MGGSGDASPGWEGRTGLQGGKARFGRAAISARRGRGAGRVWAMPAPGGRASRAWVKSDTGHIWEQAELRFKPWT